MKTNQLDTDTVLAIIEMIETSIKHKARHLPTDTKYLCYSAIGQEIALRELSNHLQEYIEGLVNQAENQMGQGE